MFRPEVVEARKDRLHGDVSLAVPLSWQAIGFLLFAGLAIAIIFLAAAPYSRIETVSGAIVVDKGISSIVPTRAGVIAELAVVDGQWVRQGQFLARIRAEEDLAGGSTAPQRVIDAIRSQDQHLSSQAGLMLNAAAAEQLRLAAGAAGTRQEITSLEQQIADQNRLVTLAEQEFHRAQEIATKGFLSRRDLELREATLIARRQELGRLQQSRTSKLASLAETARAIAQSNASGQAQAVARQELKGRIELRDVRFRYGPADPWVLDGINLVVEPGEHVAITGPSGGGKSTLVKIILGLLEPDSGEMLIDGVPLKQFGYAHYREQVGAVLQDDHLFAGSIADNISLFDDAPDMARIAGAAAAAAIHDDIAQMPMGYETLVGDMGSSLSGGQKQRVLLARALHGHPRLVVMDEATSHLDSVAEEKVLACLGQLAVTRIVCAHRSGAIAASDRQFLVAGGRAQLVAPVAENAENATASTFPVTGEAPA